MAYIGPWGQFIHIPKCAGVALRTHLKKTHRHEGVEVAGMHQLPPTIDNAFTIVRHPADWLLSFYAYCFENRWAWEDLPPYIEEQFEAARGYFWPQYVQTVTKHHAGAVGRVFDYYCQPGVTVYKLEEIDEHFPGIKKIHSQDIKPLMTEEQRRLICAAEFATIEKYAYTDNG